LVNVDRFENFRGQKILKMQSALSFKMNVYWKSGASRGDPANRKDDELLCGTRGEIKVKAKTE
jgi:hypothetical protein